MQQFAETSTYKYLKQYSNKQLQVDLEGKPKFKMISNRTDGLHASTSMCTYNIIQLQLHAVALELSFYLLSILGICFPLSVLATSLTIVALFTIRDWRNSARIYYYMIGVTNFVAAISTDWDTFLTVLITWANRWFPQGIATVTALHWELLWPPLCAVFNFVIDSILLPKVWVLILFYVHRSWIVLDPLRAPILKRMFRPALVIGFPMGLIVLNTPHLWMSDIFNGIVPFYF